MSGIYTSPSTSHFPDVAGSSKGDRGYAQGGDAESIHAIIEQAEHEIMHQPLSITTAYRLMGLLLGTLPPAVIFFQLFHKVLNFISIPGFSALMFFVCVLMNVVCGIAGYYLSDILANSFRKDKFHSKILDQTYYRGEPVSWLGFLIRLPLLGALWGLITGAMGGVFCFGFGIIFGPIAAIPVGVVGFTSFGILHRIVARDDMIEASHLVSLAVGISATITVLVLGILQVMMPVQY